MVAATDPVAVVAVFRRVGVPIDVRTIVEGESLANDGVAVVLYGTALTLVAGGTVTWTSALAHGIVAVAGGIAVGVACALIVWWLMRATSASEYEVTVTVALAYIAYLIADHLQLSGIFATASAGVLLRFRQHRDGKLMRNVDDADSFWNTGAYIVNAIVFLSTGLLIDASRLVHEPLLIVATLVVVFASRALLVIAVIRELRARLTVLVAGMRGALPLALAISLPETVPNRARIIDAVFATVFVTLVVQGLPLAPLVRALYGDQSRIGGPEPSS
jgi:CPA1 family monovalent cation:H+ antiporter